MLKITPLFSGSSGNCVHIKSERAELLIDAGVSCRSICRALEAVGSSVERLNCILVTHEHNDHTAGLETICKNHSIPVYINSRSAQAIESRGKNPHFCSCMKPFEAGEDMVIADLNIHAFHTPHDSVGSVGYRIDLTDGEDSFGYATDMGYVTRETARCLFGAKTVIFESNHDIAMLKNGQYPEYLKYRILSERGHLSNEACAKFIPHLAQNGTEKIILAHLSDENNTYEMAYETAHKALCESGFGNVGLCVAPRSILDDET